MWKASPKTGAVVKGPKKAKYCSNCRRYDCTDILIYYIQATSKQRERDNIYIYTLARFGHMEIFHWKHFASLQEVFRWFFNWPGRGQSGKRLTYLGAVFHCVIPGFVAIGGDAWLCMTWLYS